MHSRACALIRYTNTSSTNGFRSDDGALVNVSVNKMIVYRLSLLRNKLKSFEAAFLITKLTDDMLENPCSFQKALNSSVELVQLRAIFFCADLRVECGYVEQS
jgi:hypothetical protein